MTGAGTDEPAAGGAVGVAVGGAEFGSTTGPDVELDDLVSAVG